MSVKFDASLKLHLDREIAELEQKSSRSVDDEQRLAGMRVMLDRQKEAESA